MTTNGESVEHVHNDDCREYGCIEYANRLYQEGQARARQRAERVQALRIGRTHPLVLAVLERWNAEPVSASDEVVTLAVSAVQAVVNCLGADVVFGRREVADDGR